MLTSVFVYGTLKRGECRESLWPAAPASIQVGWTRGKLFHRHDYPAMQAGEDRVLGEFWSFSDDQMHEVLQVLDQIEGTNQPGFDDLYHRVHVEVYTPDNQPLGAAFGYHYATDPLDDGFTRVVPAEPEALVQWP
ncbi:AIG2-like domain protein [Rhodopirellula maiorica SM1]|uniref:AIG2-like domain protein n=1 Tax=Rhodopirellula maiorica SM1 TaxID=1265738 RepID=M5RF81_9BACT|nr:gamma-glutamylcyclotransferase family protein [Rhodopirellula maiorica]EMI18020.1 AIG2-like domain protein [Rhodopirellula maiorica SM1]